MCFCRAAFLSSLLSAFPFNFLIHSNQHPSVDLSSSSGAIQQCLLHVGQSSAVNPNDKAPRPFVNQLWIVYWMLSLGCTQHHRQESYLLLFLLLLFDLLLLLQRTGFVSTSNSSWPGRPGWQGQGLGQPVVSVVYTANGKCFVYYSLCLPLSTSLSLSLLLSLFLSLFPSHSLLLCLLLFVFFARRFNGKLCTDRFVDVARRFVPCPCHTQAYPSRAPCAICQAICNTASRQLNQLTCRQHRKCRKIGKKRKKWNEMFKKF